MTATKQDRDEREHNPLSYLFPRTVSIHNVDQGSDEWLKLRSNRATGSVAMGILTKGINYAIASNKRSYLHPHANNLWAERGHFGESIAKTWLSGSANNQFEILECGFITDDNYPHYGYSPDGILISVPNLSIYSALIEFKTFSPKKHIHCCKSIDNVPIEVIAQVQFGLFLTKLPLAYLIFCNPDAPDNSSSHSPTSTITSVYNPRLHFYKILPDQQYFELFHNIHNKYVQTQTLK